MADTDKIKILIQTEVAKAKKDLEGILKNQQKLKTDSKSFGEAFKANWLKVTAAITAAFVVIKKAFDLTREYTELQQATEAMSKQFGISADKMVKKLREVSDGTVSTKDLVLAANKAMALGVTTNIDEMAKLMEVARVRGKAMGIETTQAFEDIVTGIGRGSPLILDNLGIITKGWAEEAKAAGKSMDAQFILNKVLQDGAKILEKTGGSTLSSAEKFQKMGSTIADAKLLLGKLLSESLMPVFDAMEKAGGSGGALIVVKKAFQGLMLIVSLLTMQYKVLLQAMRVGFAPIIESAKNFGAILQAIKDRDFKALKEVGKDVWTGIKDTALDAVTSTKDIFTKMKDDAIQLVTDMDTALIEQQAATDAARIAMAEQTNITLADMTKKELAEWIKAQNEKIARTKFFFDSVNNMAQASSELASNLIARGTANEKERAIKKAKFERALFPINQAVALSNVAMNTAASILKGFSMFGPPPSPLGIAAAGAASAAGALQTAAILTRQPPPVPTFAGGGIFGRGGTALVGERGPELVNLPSGSRIIDNRSTQEIMNNNNSQVSITVQTNDPIEFVNTLKRQYGVGVFA